MPQEVGCHVSYVTCHITKVWLFITFDAYTIALEPLLGSIIPLSFGYIDDKWLHITSCLETFERLYNMFVFNRRKYDVLHEIIGMLTAYIVIYNVTKNLPALATARSPACSLCLLASLPACRPGNLNIRLRLR